jgi:hypothetical protein
MKSLLALRNSLSLCFASASLLTLCSQAHAGYWEAPSYTQTGYTQNGDVSYYPDGPGTYTLHQSVGENALRNGITTQGDGDLSHVGLDWGNQGTNGPLGKSFEKSAPRTFIATADYSIYAVLKWHRSDAQDNPPKRVYVSEHVWIGGYRWSIPSSPSVDYAKLTATIGVKDLRATAAKSPNDANYVSGDDVKIHSYPVAGDSVTLPTVEYKGQAKLDPGYEQTSQGVELMDAGYDVAPLTLSLSATPVGPYSVVKNLPDDKEYNGTTRWAMNLTDDDGVFTLPAPDPNAPAASEDKAMHAQAFINAESAFVAVAKRADGTDIFPNQKFIWKAVGAPETYVPTYFTVDNQPDILLYKWQLNGQDKVASYMLRHLGPSPSDIAGVPGSGALRDDINSVFNTGDLPDDKGAIMTPKLRDDMFRRMEAAWRGSHPPDEEQVDTSTPTKDFTWRLSDAGSYNTFGTKTSTVRAFVTGQNAEDPVIEVGKVKINWVRPKKSVYKVTIYPVTWHVPQGAGFVDLFLSIFNSDADFSNSMEGWGGEKAIQILSLPLGGEGAAAEASFTVTTDETIEQVAQSQLERTIAEAPASAAGHEAITEGTEGTARVRVEPEGDPTAGEAPEAPIEKEAPVVNTGPGCFVAGTLVLMGDGTFKAIEQLNVGDTILSKSESTGEVAPKKVLRVTVRPHIATLVLTFQNGQSIETTANHPFYVEHKGFLPAGELGIGTSIVTRAGPSLALSHVEFTHQIKTVYNCTVDQFHTYFVGNDALWVHNVDCTWELEVYDRQGTAREPYNGVVTKQKGSTNGLRPTDPEYNPYIVPNAKEAFQDALNEVKTSNLKFADEAAGNSAYKLRGPVKNGIFSQIRFLPDALDVGPDELAHINVEKIRASDGAVLENLHINWYKRDTGSFNIEGKAESIAKNMRPEIDAH